MSSATFFPPPVQQARANLSRVVDRHSDCCDDLLDASKDLLRELKRMEERYRAGIPVVVQTPEKPNGEGGL